MPEAKSGWILYREGSFIGKWQASAGLVSG